MRSLHYKEQDVNMSYALCCVDAVCIVCIQLCMNDGINTEVK